MEKLSDLKKKISQLFSKWLVVEGNRRLYGPGMPQVKSAMVDLIKAFEEVLTLIEEFSIIKKKDDIEIKVEESNISGKALQSKSVIADIADILGKLHVDSISFKKGLSGEDLDVLFSGFSMSGEDLSQQEGLKGFLENKKVAHIQVDQYSFKLLKEGETVGGEPGKTGLGGETGTGGGPGDGLGEGAEAGVSIISKKEASSLWKNYIEGNMTKWDFIGGSGELIESTRQDPKELVKVLKRVVKKQKKLEAFLADLEQKLSDLGFTAQEKNDIKQELEKTAYSPKKVTIAEDELARLKKLDKDFQKTLEERIESSLKEVKKLNTKLAEEKERINSILRQSGQGVIVIDKQGKILSLNSSAEKILGVHVKDGQNKDLKDMVRSEQVLSITTDWHKETDDFTPTKVEVIASDDKARDAIAESAAVIENEDGKAIGMVSSLPSSVAMQELEKRRGEIMDVLGHDLRAPICAAKQSLSVLSVAKDFVEGLDGQQKELMMICRRNIEKMEKLVNTIMDVRQLETGKIILRREKIDIANLVEDSVNLLKGWACDKKIELTADIEKTPEITADSERLYQVISNLIGNALKFTPEGGQVKVALKTEGTDPDKVARISVIDSGIGIKKEDLERIFNKYEQVSLRAPKGESGLGLGLSICKAVVELHNGKIWAESEEGKGSVFTFVLPFVKEEESQQ
ncbi:MAG: PAS domain-containing protein [Candidatus Omnitrophica bacterium]|nr:PAS domain-containing protein [Candidatus Omnitrophota bacterium]